jgi:hypothetical protein
MCHSNSVRVTATAANDSMEATAAGAGVGRCSSGRCTACHGGAMLAIYGNHFNLLASRDSSRSQSAR